MGIARALDTQPSDTAELFYRRENGKFIFEWIE